MKPTGHFDGFTIRSWEKNTNCKVNKDSKPMYFGLNRPIIRPKIPNAVPTHKTIEIVVKVAMFSLKIKGLVMLVRLSSSFCT